MKLRDIDYIWSVNEHTLNPLRRWWLHVLKRVIITIECIRKNNIMSYGSALTYSTMLAAVPVLAIIFGIGRGFGFAPYIEERIRESLQVSPELTDKVIEFVNSYLEHTQGGVVIGVGLIVLMYTLVSLTSNVETAFNTIWYVRSSRNLYRSIIDYMSIFFLLPFVIVITSGVNLFLLTFKGLFPDYQFVNDTVEFFVHFTPILLACLTFVLLYKFIPNTEVKWRSALWPGIVAGLIFMIVQYLYFHYQIKLSSYNAIYGSFAAIPLFMLWLHISWCICLIGGQLCYANQYMESYAFERSGLELSRRYRDSLSLLLMCRICKRFASGAKPFTVRSLAKDTHLPETIVHILLDELVGMQLLAEILDERGTTSHYLPAIDINRITVKMAMKRIDSHGVERLDRVWLLNTKEWERLRYLRSHDEDALLIDV
ncbi:MAG: YihY/virulence factor BrkB family protein [Bacteroidaceae bacterium]|nr:YihY/virulence factor BrkB family protein [Bacteroidaceae bacterium]